MSNALAPIALTISSMLFASLWEGAIAVAAVYLCLRLLPKLGASTRYAVWLLTLVVLAAAPIATAILSGQHGAPSTAATVDAMAARSGAASSAGTISAPPSIVRGQVPSASITVPVPLRRRIDVPLALSLAIALLWIVVAGARGAVLAMNLRALVTLRRTAEPLRDAYGYPVLASSRASVPLATGFVRPAVVLPASLTAELSGEALDAIVMHEVAHLRRGDVWTNGLARVLEALLALNPIAWFVLSRLSVEREIACDDWVVTRLDAGEVFANALAKMACRAMSPSLAAPSAIGSKHEVVARIERLLDGRPRRLRLSAVALTGTLVLLAIFAMIVPTVSPVLALASQGSTPTLGVAGCADRPARAQFLDPATGRPSGRWIVLKDIPKDDSPRSTVLDVSIGANGKLSKVVVISSPHARDGAAARSFFVRDASGYRPASVNCKAVASTVRVAMRVDVAAATTISIVSANYPDGWSRRHPGACRVPDLLHGGVPDVRLDRSKPLTASVLVRVDASGKVTDAAITRSSGDAAYDNAMLAAAKDDTYPLDERTGFKPVRPSGASLAWNATHGYSLYSKCTPLPSEYTWTTTFPPASS